MSSTALNAPGVLQGKPETIRWVRILAAVVLPLGPAAVAVLRFLIPYYTVDEPEAMAAGVAGNLPAQSAVLWLGLVAALTLAPAVVWIGHLTWTQVPRLTTAALALAVPGYLALGLIMAADLLMWAGVQNGLDPQTVGRLVANPHPSVAVAEVVFVLGHLVGTVLLGIALWRSRVVAPWAAALVAVSQPIHLVAAVILTSRPLDLAAWMMTAIGFSVAAFGRPAGR